MQWWVRLSMETKRPFIRVCACRHVSAPDPLEAGCRFLPLVRGPVTIQGVRDPSGLPRGSGLHGRSGAPAVRAERLPLSVHAVFLDLSQPWDRSGTVVGRTGLRTIGVRLFGRSQG